MMDAIAERTAAAGLERYEVSAYARPGHRCRHNLNYWQFGDYLGLGAGCARQAQLRSPRRAQVRWREPRMYMERALAGRALSNEADVARAQLPFEFMLNALRLREGVRWRCSPSAAGCRCRRFEAGVAEGERRGLVERGGAPGAEWLRPTGRGFDFLNDLTGLFL